MKKTLNVLLSFVFLTSLMLLTVHIFPEMKTVLGLHALIPHKSMGGEYQKVAEISLGSVSPLYFQRMGRPGGEVLFAPGGGLLAVGTENGDVLMLTQKGEKLWSKRMGLATISAMAFSPDGKRVLVGETSPRGSLTCFEAMSGRELWRMDTRQDLGINLDQKIYPAILYITLDSLGNVYAVGLRYEFNSVGQREYISRLYKFSPSGNLMQKFPVDHNIDAWVGSLAVTSLGERMIFGTSNFHLMNNLRYPDQVYCLDNQENRILWSDRLDVRPPYQTTTVRHAPAITPDGQTYGIAVGDGRVIAYNSDGSKKWTRELSQPWKIGGSYLRVTPLATKAVGENLAFFTSTTSNLANFQIPTPMEHPNGNSVFLFDAQGAIKGKYTANGIITNMSIGGNKIAISVGINIQTKSVRSHGVAILGENDAELLDYISMVGPCIFVAISSDGHTISAIEAPLKLNDGGIIGEYRLHMWSKE